MTEGGSGTLLTQYDYDAFGGLPGGQQADTFLFTGEQYDDKAGQQGFPTGGDPGLYYLRARYYDPEIGRFLTRDPLGVGHPYVYANNNPVSLIDPTGLAAESRGSRFNVPWWAGAAVGTTAVSPIPGDEAVTILIVGGVVVCVAFCGPAIGSVGDVIGSLGTLFSDGDSETEITFGHGSRHLEGTGLTQEEVEEAIEKQVKEVEDQIPVGEFFKGTVVVGGQTIPYHGYKVSEGQINVGTYGFESTR